MRSFVFAMTSVAVFILILSPMALAVDYLYVALNNNTVAKYDVSRTNANEVLNSAQTIASTNINIPAGLGFDSGGNMYVANYGNHSITKFSPSGIYQNSFGSVSNINGVQGLAIDSVNNIYVTDAPESRIVKYNALGEFQGYIGSSSNLASPEGIAIDTSGNIYAANYYWNSVSKFDSSGVFQSYVGSSSNLNFPLGLAVDAANNLFVSNYETVANTVSKFNSIGQFQATIGSPANLNRPAGLAVDASGNLYVSNSQGGSISKFNSAGEFQFAWNTSAAPGAISFAPEPSSLYTGVAAAGMMVFMAGCRKRCKTSYCAKWQAPRRSVKS